jgi:hypothetical protein
MSTFTVAPMTTTITPNPFPSVTERRATRRSPQERLFDDTAGMRQAVVLTKARWIPDAHAAVAAAVWEAIQRGVTDPQGLFDAARHGAVAQRRWEQRHRRPVRLPAIEPTRLPEPLDVADQVADRVDAVRTVAVLRQRMRPPKRDAATWLGRKLDDTGAVAEVLPSRVKSAGQRWAAAARSVVGSVHDVA